MIQHLFEVPLYEVKLDLDTKNLEQFCKKHQTIDPGRELSNVGGYQSNALNLSEPILSPLLKQIQIHSSKFAKEFNNNEQNLSNIWFNISLFGNSNFSHNHPHSDISGVYYVKTPNECGDIVFEHPAIDYLSFYIGMNASQTTAALPSLPEDFNSYNSEVWFKPAVENTLYLFPSWLKHRVEPNKNKNEERISLSFNTTEIKL